MKKTFPLANEAVQTRDLKYYIFDWDDNILHMPTTIRMEHLDADGTWKEVSVSTSTFSLVRRDTEHYRPPKGSWKNAFRNFEDAPDTTHFIEDTVTALERVEHGEKPGPSYQALKKALREGRLFAIVTARGHSPATLERAVRVFIKYALSEEERAEMLSNIRGYRQWLGGASEADFGTDVEELDRYLGKCHYSAVTNKLFFSRLEQDPIYQEKLLLAPSAAQPELAKEFAIRDFVEHVFHKLRRAGVMNRSISIGFSDDDKGNVQAVSDYVRSELAQRFGAIKFVVYDTSDRSLPKGRKVCIAGQVNLPGVLDV